MRLNRTEYVEIEVSYPRQSDPRQGPTWDEELEYAIEAAIGPAAAGGWSCDNDRWCTTLNVKAADIPAIKYAIETCFGKDVKVRA